MGVTGRHRLREQRRVEWVAKLPHSRHGGRIGRTGSGLPPPQPSPASGGGGTSAGGGSRLVCSRHCIRCAPSEPPNCPFPPRAGKGRGCGRDELPLPPLAGEGWDGGDGTAVVSGATPCRVGREIAALAAWRPLRKDRLRPAPTPTLPRERGRGRLQREVVLQLGGGTSAGRWYFSWEVVLQLGGGTSAGRWYFSREGSP
jgi:hypothetical protein